MTDQPAKPPEDSDPQPVNSPATDAAAALARIDTLKRSTVEIRDALLAKLAAHRDPSSPAGQFRAWSRERFTEYERDFQRRQLRTNIWSFCRLLFQVACCMTGLLGIVSMSITLLRSTI